jgi:hypothetical protein
MLKNDQLELPSNQKFGFFFMFIFLGSSVYFYLGSRIVLTYIFAVLAVILLVITFIKPVWLLPFNRLWMRFGLLLGKVVSPLVLGVIFFGLFAPIAIVMRIFRRDELKLKLIEQNSHWIDREIETQYTSFKQQF